MHANIRFHSAWLNRFSIVVLAVSGLNASRVQAEFVHPGVAHSAESIAFAKTQIEANEQPSAQAWKELSESRSAQLDWQPKPSAHVERGASNNPDIGSSEFSSDAAAAYTHALCWALKHHEMSMGHTVAAGPRRESDRTSGGAASPNLALVAPPNLSLRRTLG